MMLEGFEPDYPKGLPRDGAAEPKVRAFLAPAATIRTSGVRTSAGAGEAGAFCALKRARR